MLAEVGTILVGIALAVAAYSAFAASWSIRRDDPLWALSARNGVFASAAVLGSALVLLLAAFLTNQFQIRYVASHSSRAVPIYLRASAVWAGQEGSLLLWAFLQALFTALAVGKPSEQTRRLAPWATVVLCLITTFFTAIVLFFSNPFTLSEVVPPDGRGLNPLLRHPGMIFHPPALFVGYVGLAVPFAFALAALITRQVDTWTAIARRWTLAAWLFLGLGLLLGARWAYDVLGWGGYWGWDPVENAGLMPWLTATALLHGFVIQEGRGRFRLWNLALALLSFALVLFGTFTTRSGLIQSVHAFARSPSGPYFLGAIGVILTVSIALIVDRRAILTEDRPMDGLLSRDGTLFLTLVFLLTTTISILIGSVLPTITEALSGQRLEAGPAWFNRVVGPQLAALVFLMGICPLLGSAAGAVRRLRARAWPAVIGAVAVPVVGFFAGFAQPLSLVGFSVIGLAGATTVAECARDVAARSRRLGESLPVALGSLIVRNRRRYGGLVVHAGVILIALGVIGTELYSLERDVVLSQGHPVTVGGYTLLVEGLGFEPTDDHVTATGTLAVYRDGEFVATLQPTMRWYSGFETTVTVPTVRATLREDLYVVLAGWSNDGTTTLKVVVNPLASFLWMGGLLLLAGGTVAVWPAAQAARLPTAGARARATRRVTGLVLGLLVLVAACVALWGIGPGETAPSVGRPLPGQAAPGFALELLDGSSFRLADKAGQVAVLNFWATWCPPCEEEMPALQMIWEEYRGEGVAVVGIAYQDQESAVRDTLARMDVTYSVGMDTGDRIYDAYGLTGVPETFVIDQAGNVAYLHIGPVSAQQLRGELDALLER